MIKRNKQKQISIELAVLAFLLAFYFSLPSVSLASTTNGAIQNQYAWGENVGWVNFAVTGSNVHVTDTGLSGNAWDTNYGWINLAPTNSGVKNDGQGNLSGSAWSAGGGYIDFTGVVIDSTGKFTGMASGTAYGRISFDCSKCSVTTDWRPVRNRPVSSSVNSGSSSGSRSGSYTSGSRGIISSISNYYFPKSETTPASLGERSANIDSASSSAFASAEETNIDPISDLSSPRPSLQIGGTAPIMSAFILNIVASIVSIILIFLVVLRFWVFKK
jgi:hypothetical protein